jgi:ribosomal protein RSM22 (predicted rRNA methylase)
MASNRSRGRKWDGKSRVSNDRYRKNYNKIFRKTEDPFNKKVEEGERNEKELKEIEERNGF